MSEVTRADEIERLVAGCSLKTDNRQAIREIIVLCESLKSTRPLGTLRVVTPLERALGFVLPAGGVVGLLGDDPRVSDLFLLAHFVLKRAGEQMEPTGEC